MYIVIALIPGLTFVLNAVHAPFRWPDLPARRPGLECAYCAEPVTLQPLMTRV